MFTLFATLCTLNCLENQQNQKFHFENYRIFDENLRKALQTNDFKSENGYRESLIDFMPQTKIICLIKGHICAAGGQTFLGKYQCFLEIRDLNFLTAANFEIVFVVSDKCLKSCLFISIASFRSADYSTSYI